MCKSKRMEVFDTGTDAVHASNNVEIMKNFLVTILQDDFMLIDGNSGNTTAIDGTTMKFEEVEEPVPLESVSN